MEHLFSAFQLKNIRLPNRIVMPSLASFLIESDGSITEQAVEHYRRRAGGGVAMVIIEACGISPEGIVSVHQARIHDDRFVEGLARIAAAIAAEGAVPAIQLHHGGRQISPRVIGRRPLAPSPLPCPSIKGEVEPLSLEGIADLVRKFAEAAERACQAGYELIEIHGAHGYLVNQFLSGFSNIRTDAYGGDVAGRTRFAEEIVREIRGGVGADKVLSFKISAQEYVAKGLAVPESIEILKILSAAGIDIVQVSAGNDATPEWISQPMFMPKACLVDSAAQIKQALDIPVMAVGRINDPLLADAIIREDKADLVCIGRGLLADPELPRKAAEGRIDEIRTCIACNTCMESIFRKGRVECLVNPTLGREKEMTITPAAEPKKVMVVGGGPAGLNAAWVAASRGHEVHLFEKQAALGGLLIAGSAPRFKQELRSLIRFHTTQIEKTGVHTVLNHEVTAEDVRELDPDVVILAAGSRPFLPPVDGVDKPLVTTFDRVLNHLPSERDIVVVGGGPTGCEVALHLAEEGCRVTVVEMLPKVGKRIEAMTKRVLLRKLSEHGVRLLTDSRLIRIEDAGVVVENDAREESIAAELVVVAAGTKPDESLATQIADSGYTVHQVGDCREPRDAKAAIFESAVIARSI